MNIQIYINTILLFLLSGCNIYQNESIIILGDPKATHKWIYLCGLVDNFYSSQEIEIRQQLNNLAGDLNIAILAIKPPQRCRQFHNALCWPHNTNEEVLSTYKYIQEATKGCTIAGFIGFSNGGFFLNKLVQMIELHKPIISIGAAGAFYNAETHNKLFLIIGKQDTYHYADAKALFEMTQKSQLHINFIEHDGGHIIPMKTLKDIIKQ